MSAAATSPGRGPRFVVAPMEWWLARPRAWRVALVVAIGATLWWLSSRPGMGGPGSLPAALGRNAMHAVAFGGLAAAIWCACRTRALPEPQTHAAVAAILGAVLYGVVDECHQSMVPGRTASFVDVVTDACGAALVTWWLRMRLERRDSRHAVGFVLLAACAASACVATLGPW